MNQRDWEAFKDKHQIMLVGVLIVKKVTWLELNASQGS